MLSTTGGKLKVSPKKYWKIIEKSKESILRRTWLLVSVSLVKRLIH